LWLWLLLVVLLVLLLVVGELAGCWERAVLVARCVDGGEARLDLHGFSGLGLEML
jgi:hypothetical protein